MKEQIKFEALYKICCIIYKSYLRDLLIKAIDDPDKKWDDYVLKLADMTFDC